MSVVIETSIGDLVIDLYTEERPNCKIGNSNNNKNTNLVVWYLRHDFIYFFFVFRLQEFPQAV